MLCSASADSVNLMLFHYFTEVPTDVISEYAAAWFLLAGRLQDAVNVCVHQLQDLQLGVAIARVYEGDESPVIRSLLEDRVLPQAALEGNRWLATWAFWMLGRRDLAVRALIVISLRPKTRSLANVPLCSYPYILCWSHLQHRICNLDPTSQMIQHSSSCTSSYATRHFRRLKAPPVFHHAPSGSSLSRMQDCMIE